MRKSRFRCFATVDYKIYTFIHDYESMARGFFVGKNFCIIYVFFLATQVPDDQTTKNPPWSNQQPPETRSTPPDQVPNHQPHHPSTPPNQGPQPPTQGGVNRYKGISPYLRKMHRIRHRLNRILACIVLHSFKNFLSRQNLYSRSI